jgi:hypothetical protein
LLIPPFSREHDAKNCQGSGEGKVDAQIRNKENMLAVHLGAQKGQADALRIMHEMGQIPDLEVRTLKKATPLLCATSWHRPITSRLLVELGADVTAADLDKQTVSPSSHTNLLFTSLGAQELS